MTHDSDSSAAANRAAPDTASGHAVDTAGSSLPAGGTGPAPRSTQEVPLARTPAQDAALARHYFQAAAIVLIAGLAAAGYLYWAAVDDGTDAVLAQMSHGKDYDYQLQRMGGQAMVLMAEFNDWFSGLWHGTNLAYMLGGGSLLTALVCFWIGRRLRALARMGEAAAAPGE